MRFTIAYECTQMYVTHTATIVYYYYVYVTFLHIIFFYSLYIYRNGKH